MRSVLETISEQRRLRILELIWEKERSASEIARAFKNITFGAISQHLGVLLAVEAVSVRREGRMRFYRARKERLGPFAPALEAMWRDQLAKLKELSEAEANRAVPHEKNAS